MNRKSINKILGGVSILWFLVPQFIFAQTGNHFGEQKFLSYEIEYLNDLGVTTVDETGITYKPYTCCESHQDTILPERYFDDYALYFAGGTMEFKVVIKNEGPRTFRNLKIETFQEFLNVEGRIGEGIGEDNYHVWFIEKLGSGEEVELFGEFIIPTTGDSGIDQTHLRISHWDVEGREGEFTRGQTILEDFQAGLWCPL